MNTYFSLSSLRKQNRLQSDPVDQVWVSLLKKRLISEDLAVCFNKVACGEVRDTDDRWRRITLTDVDQIRGRCIRRSPPLALCVSSSFIELSWFKSFGEAATMSPICVSCTHLIGKLALHLRRGWAMAASMAAPAFFAQGCQHHAAAPIAARG